MTATAIITRLSKMRVISTTTISTIVIITATIFRLFCSVVEDDKTLLAPEPTTAVTASLPIHPAAQITTSRHGIRSMSQQTWDQQLNTVTNFETIDLEFN
jgi:hypothetical protein